MHYYTNFTYIVWCIIRPILLIYMHYYTNFTIMFDVLLYQFYLYGLMHYYTYFYQKMKICFLFFGHFSFYEAKKKAQQLYPSAIKNYTVFYQQLSKFYSHSWFYRSLMFSLAPSVDEHGRPQKCGIEDTLIFNA